MDDKLFDSNQQSMLSKVRGALSVSPLLRTDPLAYLVVTVFRLSPLSFALIATIVSLGGAFAVSAINDLLIRRMDRVSIIDDPSSWIWLGLLTPVLAGYYLWAPQALQKVVLRLHESDVVQVSTQNFETMRHVYDRLQHKYVALGVAVIVAVLFFLARADLPGWAGNGILPRAFTTIGFALGAYMAMMLVFALIANIQVLRQILSNKEFHVNPLHPDRCGGLRPLSDYSLRTAYLVAVFGVLIGFTIYRFHRVEVADIYWWYISLSILFYLTISAACFFAPLSTAHQGMKYAKDKLLDSIAEQFEVDYERTQNELDQDGETLKNRIEKIEHLRTIYDLTDQFPVWPFDFHTIRNYLAATAGPLIPPLIGLSIQYLQDTW